MIFKHKKAQGGGPQWTVVEYILVFIGLVILTIILLRITGVWHSAFTESTCSTSVYARSSTIIKGTQLVSLKCATQYKCFTAGGKCPAGYDKVPVANDNEIKQKLAEEMYLCWKMLGQGKIRFVDDKAVSTRLCLPCSVITFDDKLKGRQITGFQTYLETANTSAGVTYMQYFTNANKIEMLGQEGILDTNKDYTVVYSLYTGEFITKIAGGTAGTIGLGFVGCKAGGVVGFLLTFGNPVGTAIGCGAGAVGGGIYGFFKGSQLLNWASSQVGWQKEIIPAISLDEYSAEALKDCKSFVNI